MHVVCCQPVERCLSCTGTTRFIVTVGSSFRVVLHSSAISIPLRPTAMGAQPLRSTLRLVAVDLNDVVLVLVIIVLVSKREVVLIEHRRVDDFGVRRWRSR